MIAADWQIEGFKKIAKAYGIDYIDAVNLTCRVFGTTVLTADMIEFMVEETSLVRERISVKG